MTKTAILKLVIGMVSAAVAYAVGFDFVGAGLSPGTAQIVTLILSAVALILSGLGGKDLFRRFIGK